MQAELAVFATESIQENPGQADGIKVFSPTCPMAFGISPVCSKKGG